MDGNRPAAREPTPLPNGIAEHGVAVGGPGRAQPAALTVPAASPGPRPVPVLIVGGGPAGLTASLLLSQLGIASMLIERRPQPSPLPRATGVNVRSMEIFRSLGLERAIDDASMPTGGVPFLLAGETLSADPRATVESRQYEPPSVPGWPSPTYARWCAQDDLESVLLDAIGREPRSQVCLGTELMSFDTGAGVSAVVRDVVTGAARTVHAEYLLGADGASSRVRDRLGIAMRGQAGLSHQLSILFRADLDPILRSRRFCLYRIENDTVTGVMRPAGRSGRWLFGTPADPGMSPQRCIELVRAAVGVADLDVEVIATGAWEACAQVADTFRAGPVLLVGDSAHQHTPGGGFGMTSAIAAAHNLAWKLAAVLARSAGPALLDSYETERRPLAQLTASLSARLLQAGVHQSARTLGVVLGARYDDGALIPDGSPAPQVNDPVADYEPCARPGHRAPHHWLDRARITSTLDLFKSTFVICTAEPADWQPAVKEATTAGLPVRIATLPAEATRTYGIGPTGAVLVRPDGYVAARWAASSDARQSPLGGTLTTILAA
jgi:putative polyketide hydroxylase